MTEREFDVVVIGAGPAGLAAAARAAEAGSAVLVVDEGMRPGGQIWRHQHVRKLPDQARAWLERLQRTRAVVLAGSTVVEVNPDRRVIAESAGQRMELHARRAVVLAVGARELFLPFPGWTLPGVTGVGGAQALLKSGLDVRNKRIVLAGSGPLLLAVGAALARAGANVRVIAEQTPLSQLIPFSFTLLRSPARLLDAARYRLATAGARYQPGVWVKRALGETQVRGALLTDGSREWTVDCDLLGVGYGLIPALELPRLLGCTLKRNAVVVDEQQQTSLAGFYCAGETTGIGGVDAALVEGQIAGLAAAGARSSAELLRERAQHRIFARAMDQAFALRAELSTLAEPETMVCRCEDVTLGRVREHNSLREAKLMTRAGMGACQGRVCGSALQHLYGWPPDSVRSPAAAARVGTLAATRSGVES